MERHQSPTTERHRLLRTATALATAANVLMSAGGDAAPDDRSSSTFLAVEQVAASKVPAEAMEPLPVIPPEFTIIVPNQPNSKQIDWSVKLPNVSELRDKGQWCETPNVPLFQRATSEQLAKAAEIRMGLSTEAFDLISEQLDQSESREESQELVRQAYANIGVKVTFNKYKPGLNAETDEFLMKQPESALFSFNRDLIEQMEALASMPLEMAQAYESVDFIEAKSMATLREDGSKNGIDGYFTADKDGPRVVIRLGSGKRVTFHEAAHALHHKACNSSRGQQVDGEFQQAYDKALRLLRTNRSVARLRKHWPRDQFDKTEWAWFSPKHGDVTGFPSDYSITKYTELFAELTTDLMLRGDISDDVPYESDQSRELKQLAVERLQAALPSVDVASLVAARAAYKVNDYDEVSVQQLLRKRVSPIDLTYAESYRDMGVNGELMPAINIKSLDGTRNEFIYAYHSDLLETAEGLYGGNYAIFLRPTGDSTLDDALIQKSIQYLRTSADKKGITLEYEVRHIGDRVYVMGIFEERGTQRGETKVRYTDFTKPRQHGTGG